MRLRYVRISCTAPAGRSRNTPIMTGPHRPAVPLCASTGPGQCPVRPSPVALGLVAGSHRGRPGVWCAGVVFQDRVCDNEQRGIEVGTLEPRSSEVGATEAGADEVGTVERRVG